MQPLKVWDAVIARVVHGERASMAVVELEPDSVVPEHSHDNEQLGIVLQGTITFRIGTETRELGPGATYRIAPNTPHAVLKTCPDGAVVIDVFAPVRADWRELEVLDVQPPVWPEEG